MSSLGVGFSLMDEPRKQDAPQHSAAAWRAGCAVFLVTALFMWLALSSNVAPARQQQPSRLRFAADAALSRKEEQTQMDLARILDRVGRLQDTLERVEGKLGVLDRDRDRKQEQRDLPQDSRREEPPAAATNNNNDDQQHRSSNGCDADPHACAAAAKLKQFKQTVLQNHLHRRTTLTQRAWALFPPIVSCPPGRPLTRYGSEGDGGKLLCQLDRSIRSGSSSKCLVYSLGSKGQFDFEEAMLRETECDVHTFDCTYDGRSLHPTRHTYHKWCLSSDDKDRGDYRTWSNITTALGHTHVDVLKMDIEGYEFGVLASLAKSDSKSLPKELSMEFHVGGGVAAEPARPQTVADLARVFLELLDMGYATYSTEINELYPNNACEYTFFRVDV